MNRIVSVIVPVSRIEKFKNTLQGLSNQTYPHSQFEIIVVSSIDYKYFNRLSDIKFSLIKTERLFAPGKMRNIGAENASGDFYYFIDDDCIPPPEWIQNTISEFNKTNIGRIGTVGCRVVSVEDKFWNRCADYSLFTDYQHRKRRIGPIGSAAIAVKKEAFNDVGGFDESLLASEDWDFCLKMINKQWQCVFMPSVEIKHDHGRAGFIDILKMGFLSGYRSGLFVQKKHKEILPLPSKIVVHLSKPFLFPIIALPYTVLLAGYQVYQLRGTDRRLWLFSPFIILRRLSYIIGVWVKLFRE